LPVRVEAEVMIVGVDAVKDLWRDDKRRVCTKTSVSDERANRNARGRKLTLRQHRGFFIHLKERLVNEDDVETVSNIGSLPKRRGDGVGLGHNAANAPMKPLLRLLEMVLKRPDNGFREREALPQNRRLAVCI
jgi:hypothetical protein